MTWNEDWAGKALCNQARPDELFVRGAAQNRAKQLCAGCPVRTECLAEALDNQIEWGVWGGMTERERRALLRAGPTSPRGGGCSRPRWPTTSLPSRRRPSSPRLPDLRLTAGRFAVRR